MKITIEAEMADRWIAPFLGMLKRMEMLGNIGASRKVTIYSDGDGDFRPKFSITSDSALPEPCEPVCDNFFDAG